MVVTKFCADNRVTRLVAALSLCLLQASAFAQVVRFAVIGDQGRDNANQATVAARLAAYDPQFIVTVGDNNYHSGSLADWDRTVGKYYSQFIKYPAGSASQYANNGVVVNNFFPSLGNHDWDAGINSYTNYFDLPGNERYYSVRLGPIELFILDSDSREPDGRTQGSVQYEWASQAIQSSTADWQFVFFHHPAWTYRSSHGAELTMRWPFKQWGVDAVISGHNHNMQRMDAGGLPYYVIGSSGGNLYTIYGPPTDATGLFSNHTALGFLLVEACQAWARFQFIDSNGNVLDTSLIPEPAAVAAMLAAMLCLLRLNRIAVNTVEFC